MAELQKKTKTIVEGVVLTLSNEEANAISAVLARTAGGAREIERVWSLLDDNDFTGSDFVVQKTGTFRVDPKPHW